jgi:hypothetical protein
MASAGLRRLDQLFQALQMSLHLQGATEPGGWWTGTRTSFDIGNGPGQACHKLMQGSKAHKQALIKSMQDASQARKAGLALFSKNSLVLKSKPKRQLTKFPNCEIFSPKA